IGESLPEHAKVVVAKPLDWLHVAPELWLEHGHEVVVARNAQLFAPALDWFVQNEPERPVFGLAGEVVGAGPPVHARASSPALPDGWNARRLRTYRWPAHVLERTSDRPPRALLEQEAQVTLFRLEPPRGAAVSVAPKP